MTNSDSSSIADKCFRLLKISKESENNILDKYYQLLYGSSDIFVHKFPYKLILQLTSECNLRCKHCFFNDKQEKYLTKNNLNKEELFSAIKYFVEEVNILSCIITGGEIFTSPFTLDIIEYFKKNAIIIKLVTNGTLINENIARSLSKLLNPKCDVIQISLDGATKETNDSIRGTGSYENVINALELLKKYKLNIEISFTTNSRNVNEIPLMYELSQTYGIKKLNIGKISLESEKQKYLIPKTEDLFKNISKLYDIYDNSTKLCLACLKIPDFLRFEEGIHIIDYELKKGLEYPDNLSCKPHSEQVAMFANGDISLCYDCTVGNVIIGNIKNDSFENIWKNRKKLELFQDRITKKHPCRKCKYLSLCLSGCPYRALQKYGTIYAPGLECEYFNKLQKEKNDRNNL